jgi:hypothetical protein
MPFNSDEEWNCDNKGKYDDENLFKKSWTTLYI